MRINFLLRKVALQKEEEIKVILMWISIHEWANTWSRLGYKRDGVSHFSTILRQNERLKTSGVYNLNLDGITSEPSTGWQREAKNTK